MGNFGKRGKAKAMKRQAERAMAAGKPVPRTIEVPRSALAALQVGVRCMTKEQATALANAAIATQPGRPGAAAMAAAAMGCGTALISVVEALRKHVTDPENPPAWYTELFALVQPPAPVPTEGPVKDRQELHERAAQAGLVIAGG